MKPQMVTVSVTTNGWGAFSTTIATPQAGRFLQYRYVPDGSSPIDTRGDIDLTGATSGFVYINQDNIGTTAFQKLPRYATQDETGTASLYAAGGEPVEGYMWTGGEMLTFAVANGGASKAGTFYFWYG